MGGRIEWISLGVCNHRNDVQSLSCMCSSVQHGSAFFALDLPTALRNGHMMQNGRVKGGVSIFFLSFDAQSPYHPAAFSNADLIREGEKIVSL